MALQGEEGKRFQKDTEHAHQYILEPVSAQAKMTRNTTALPLRSANTPRFATTYVSTAVYAYDMKQMSFEYFYALIM